MPEIVHRCPLCGENHSQTFDRRQFRGFEVHNRLCLRCGLVFQSPRMTSTEREAFYQQTYRQLYQGSVEPTPKDHFVQRERAEHLLAFARKHIPTVSRHLDIGCSTGMLLQRFQAHFHSEAVGVEPGEAYRDFAQRQGLRVYPSLASLEEADEARFDLVSMAHVLEHLPDPISYLAHLRERWLSPSGWLLLEVPNLYAHDSFEVAHLIAFSAHTLREVVELAGFAAAHLREHGTPRSRLLPLYLTLLAHAGGTPSPRRRPTPERGVSLKRRLGLLRRRIIERTLPSLAWLPIPETKE